VTEPWKPNVTVAAIVVGTGAHRGRYLMVEERTRDGLRINQPAGHLEPGESLIDAVVRETLEETAHCFVPSGLLCIYLSRSLKTNPREPAEPVTYLRFAFVGTVGAAIDGMTLDDGIVRALWMTVDEVRATSERHRSPMVRRCVEDHAAGRPLGPLDLLCTDPSALSSD
jgi:8-oxo-dGTP pyrophosphatase MutT (NUDIX family)